MAPPKTLPLMVNMLCLLAAESARGLVVASLYSYILSLSGEGAGRDKALASDMNAAAFSCFSIGRLVAAPILGWLSDRLPYRTVFLAALLVSIGGHMLYATAADMGSVPSTPDAGPDRTALSVLVFSRVILGLGTGILSVCRAVVTVLTATSERTRWFSLLSLAKFVGYSLTPLLAAIHVQPRTVLGMRLDKHTMPGVILSLACAVLAPLVFFLLDPAVGKGSTNTNTSTNTGTAAATATASAATSTAAAAASAATIKAARGAATSGAASAQLPSSLPLGTAPQLVAAAPSGASASATAGAAAGRIGVDGVFDVTDVADVEASVGGAGAVLVPASRAFAVDGGSDNAGDTGERVSLLSAAARTPSGGSSNSTKQAAAHPSLLPSSTAGQPVWAIAAAAKASQLRKRIVLGGVALFLALNIVGKGVLTLCEVILTPMYAEARGLKDVPVETVAVWFGLLGCGGLISFAYLSLKKPSHPPPDVWVLAASFLLTAIGCGMLGGVKHDAASLTPVYLDAAAAIIWCIAAPIGDVLTTSLFSQLVDPQAAGAWMGWLTMAGSVGRVSFAGMAAPLGERGAAATAGALAALCLVAIWGYGRWKTLTLARAGVLLAKLEGSSSSSAVRVAQLGK